MARNLVFFISAESAKPQFFQAQNASQRCLKGLGNWSGRIPRALPKATFGRTVGAKTEGDHAADIPIQEDHVGIGGEGSAMLTSWFLIFFSSWRLFKDKYKRQKSQDVKQ